MALDNRVDRSWMDRLQPSYGVATALALGSRDGINLFSLSITLTFLSFLIHRARSSRAVLSYGFIALAAQFVMTVLLVHGRFDFLMSKEQVVDWIKMFYWFYAAAIVLIGGVYFRDWWLHRSGQLDKLTIKSRTEKTQQTSRGGVILRETLKGFVPALYAIFVVVLGSIATQDYTVFMMIVKYSRAGDDIWLARKVAYTYSASFMFPTLVAFLLAYCYHSSEKLKSKLSDSISMVKVVCSAVYLSVGVGLLLTLYYF